MASANTWVKVDLGRVSTFSRISFGRDRTGTYDDRNGGQFWVYVAENDAVYAMGDSSDDETEYTLVYDSANADGYTAGVSGGLTAQVTLSPAVSAQFLKLQFASPGTCIDEIEVS